MEIYAMDGGVEKMFLSDGGEVEEAATMVEKTVSFQE